MSSLDHIHPEILRVAEALDSDLLFPDTWSACMNATGAFLMQQTTQPRVGFTIVWDGTRWATSCCDAHDTIQGAVDQVVANHSFYPTQEYVP